MIKPQFIRPTKFFSIPEAERQKFLVDLEAWEQSPEGIAEKEAERAKEAAQKAISEARYESLLPAAIRAKLVEVGVPERVLCVLWEDVAETPAVAAVREMPDMVVLSGACGCGKTVAAGHRMRMEVGSPKNWHPTSPSEFFSDRKACDDEPVWCGRESVWATSSDLIRTDHYDRKEFERISKAPLLVIDDLGSEFFDVKGFFGSFVDEIVNIRYAGKKPTVITTNLAADAFKARYGARVSDRIREAGRFVSCGSASLRYATVSTPGRSR